MEQLIILILSMVVAVASFWYLAAHYSYPQVSQTTLDLYLPWVASRTAINTPYKYWWPAALLYIPTVTYGMWLGASWLRGKKLMPKVSWPSMSEKIVWPGVWEVGFFTVLIVGLLVNFSYNAFYQFFYNYHHLNFITGPLNDVLHGKILLVDTKTQYGFLNIFLTSWLFKAGWYFSHPNVHFLSMILGVLEYLAVYLILRLLTKSRLISLLGIIVTTSFHFYGVFPTLFPSEFFLWPGGSVWRFFPAMPAIFLTLWWSKDRRTILLHWSQLTVGVALLWDLEMGIPLVAGYVAALMTITYLTKGLLLERIREFIKRIFGLSIYVLLMMGSYDLYTYLAVRQWPNWSQYYYYVELFNSGFLQYPNHAPLMGYVYWPILVYAIVILSAMIRKYFRFGLPIRDIPVLTMLSIYGYGIFRYYLGKQSESDWAAVIIPAAIVLVYLYSQCANFLAGRKWGRVVAIVIFGIVFTLPIVKFVEWGVKLEKHRLSDYRLMKYDPNFNYPPKNRLIAVENTAVPTVPISELMESAKLIQRYTPNNERVAIIGYFDHVLLMQAERVNLADYSYLHATLYTKSELDGVVNLYRTVPKYLFVDKRVIRRAVEYRNTPTLGENTLITIFDRVKDNFEYIDEAPMVFVYRRIN